MFKNTKGVIRNHKQKNNKKYRQYKGQTKDRKTIDCVTGAPFKTRVPVKLVGKSLSLQSVGGE
jgi:hypothetical protein